MNLNHKTPLTLAVGLLTLSLISGLALGQGGTGRENTNKTTKTTTPKKTPPPARRRPTNSGSTTRSSCLAKSPAQASGRTHIASLILATNQAYRWIAKPPDSPTMELVEIPAGSFCMGATNGEAGEKPVHQVTINYSFYLGKYEVTQAQWQAVMGSNPSNFKDCGGNCPVEQVSWDDAQAFIRKLNQMNDGYSYRLPTEAEWEYACRAGTTGDYAGNLSEMAWYSDNSENKTHAVGSKQSNAWGLADMHGNVWEWCLDWYHETYYGAPTDGSAWVKGREQKSRVLRGGSWVIGARYLRSSALAGRTADDRSYDNGFRVVAVPRTSTNTSLPTPATLDEDPVLTPPDARNLQSGDTKSTSTTDPATEKVYTFREVDQRARILSKPPPSYTEEARKNQITGTVVLRAVLPSTGQVTNITVVRGLPDGLTERVTEAARRIKFIPAVKNGKPVSQYITLEYNLNLY